jgi:DNA polymerase
MALSEPLRCQYLDAMGIRRWEPRAAVPHVATAPTPVTVAEPTAAYSAARADDAVNVITSTLELVAADLALDSTTKSDTMRVNPPPRTDVATPQTPVNAMDWTALEAEAKACTRCRLHATRTHAVFGVGNRNAQWLFVGEAPGADEDRQGEPFVGRAGQLLNAMLFALGLKREDVYIANVLKSRPPNNRDPQDDEVAACEPYLVRQIELIKPRLIVALGRHAAHSLLKTDVALAKLRGQRLQYHGIPLIVTYHPAYLLRTPSDKRKAWDDLCLARSVVAEAAG